MFNNFTFNPKHTKCLQEFLRDDGNLIVLMDPPFGGRIEPLAETIKSLRNEYNAKKRAEGKSQKLFEYFPRNASTHGGQSASFCNVATKFPATVENKEIVRVCKQTNLYLLFNFPNLP